MRIPTKPAASPTMPVTNDRLIRKAPTTAPMTAMARRMPCASTLALPALDAATMRHP
jgi:hypothetical protein